MSRIVTFGELMLRLAPNGYYRFFQDDQLQATFGGAGQLLIALPLAFLVLLFLLWLVIFVAGYIRRHASRIRTSLGETVAAKETPPSSPEEK